MEWYEDGGGGDRGMLGGGDGILLVERCKDRGVGGYEGDRGVVIKAAGLMAFEEGVGGLVEGVRLESSLLKKQVQIIGPVLNIIH